MPDELDRNSVLRVNDPDSLQQLLNRLQKRYEDLNYEDRHIRLIKEIKGMDLSEPDLRELLRRIG